MSDRALPRPGSCAAPATKPWLAAALWLALLGPGFFVVYGWCNAVSAGRAHVPSLFFDWERHIPFVPWMIVPYVSIDLFFAGSFFLCRDRAQLRVHAARIALAIGLSATVFLLCPLRYGWTRPAVDGWLGLFFAPLNALDQPYNLCPSLHISLRTILWRVYGPSLRPWPWLRAALWGWFVLIGLSTLFVYQHHVIDLLGGYAVALFCCRCFPEKTAARPPPADTVAGCRLPEIEDQNVEGVPATDGWQPATGNAFPGHESVSIHREDASLPPSCPPTISPPASLPA